MERQEIAILRTAGQIGNLAYKTAIVFPKPKCYTLFEYRQRIDMLEVRLLGAFEVRDGKKVVRIPSRPAQSLFAYLIQTADTRHRREKLAGLLWPDSLEETARDNLRHALWRIRKALPPKNKVEYLLADDIAIGFNAASEYWLDTSALDKVGKNASSDELIAVLSNYHGELLPGFYDEWVVLEREHLNSIFEHHMARLMSFLQDEKRWLDILDWGERWIALGQKPEPAYRALMSAHAAEGDMSKVAATYERCVKSLKEFGVEPSEQTRHLYEDLRTDRKKLAKGSPPAPKEESSRSGTRTNLPISLTSFIGREKDVEEVIRLLDRNRLVTLTGPGGVGKTRLAIQSSNRVLSKFRDGVWWVELAPLSDGALAPQAAAQALGVREIHGQPLAQSLRTFLREKQALLVLDNCEHLTDDCAQLADDLLTHCANLKILTTSRETLGITGEMAYQVPSLSLPAPQNLTLTDLLMEYEGIRFFVERAGAVKPDFVLTEQNAAAVVQICKRLDGIPLALELAAARIKLLTAEHIAERLDDRFNLLTQGSRAALPRHKTLRAAIDWSYELLPEDARILFRRLSVFPGGFTLEAAEEVCSESPLTPPAVLDLLARLVDRSLVKAEREENTERYSMLETLREYAREKLDVLGETNIIRDRHLDHFVHFAEQAELSFMASASYNWHALLEAEINNLRNAMKWSVTPDTLGPSGEHPRLQAGLRLAGALYWIWDDRDFPNETSVWVRDIVSKTRLPTAYRARALMSLGVLRATLNNFTEARPCFEEALTICQYLGDPFLLATALTYRGAIDEAEANYASAQSFLEQGLVIAEEMKIVPLIGWNLSLMADTILMQGNPVRAKELYERSANIFNGVHHKDLLAYQLRRLGYLAVDAGKFAEAVQRFRESLEMNRATQFQYGIIASLTAFARLALAENKCTRAAQLYGAIDGQLSAVAYCLYLMDEVEYKHGEIELRARLEESSFENAWTEGRAMTLEQVIAFTLEESR